MRRVSLAAFVALIALIAVTLLLLFAAGTVSRARAEGTQPDEVSASGAAPSTPESATTLTKVGSELEQARILPADQRGPALERVSGRIAERIKAGLSDDERRVASFLSGEVRYAAGDYDKATDAYRRAERDADGGPFADDAAFAAVTAMEAAGRDAEAARAWTDWERRYPKSPLLPEARLARTWNAMRRGALPEATNILTKLRETSPWFVRDPRFLLAAATNAYLQGHASEALAMLEGGSKAAPETYLRALCYSQSGDVLKAAAYFQEAADRGSDSPLLRDYALLAKANTFMTGKAYRNAADEFARVTEVASRPEVRAEAELRHAACFYLAGEPDAAIEALRQTAAAHDGTDVAARAQYLLGEVLYEQKLYAESIVELNRILTQYFDHEIAAAAQYRVGMCLDALGRKADATSTYQAVVSGYPLALEAPAAAYLAGIGLLDENRPLDAVPYFQLVLDRYAKTDSSEVVLSSPEHQELVEAALCHLELAYHRAGNFGQLAGMPHLMLTRMPPSKSQWRAFSLLIDADAMAAMGRYKESQDLLATLISEFPNQDLSVRATRLLAWTYAREGKDELAAKTEEEMLARYASLGDIAELSTAYLNKAHVMMNRKQYKEAASAYEDFLSRFPNHDQRSLALYQLGLAYHRLDRDGDAVDRWERIVSLEPATPIAEKAWTRAGDVYFQAEHYDEAKRCYEGLLANFSSTAAAGRALLRIAQCEYNAGHDPEALERFSEVISKYPNGPEAQEAQRGTELALYRLGQGENAAEVLSQLVEKYPQSSFAADAQFQVAMSHYQKKEFTAAAEAFRQVVSRFPGFSGADRATFLIADSYAQSGDKTDAKNTYEQFLIFFPESELRSTVRFRLGAMRFEEGNYMQAAVDFTALLEMNPSAEMAGASLYNLALCQKMLGRMEEARGSLERYREAHPNDERAADIALQLAEIHEQAGENEASLEELERAATAGPSQAHMTEVQYRLGLAREHHSDLTGALRAYEKAIDAPEKADAFRLSALARLGAIYEGQGKTERALAAYRDLMRNATDPELVAAAGERAEQLKRTAK